jgi:hypothetical protein
MQASENLHKPGDTAHFSGQVAACRLRRKSLAQSPLHSLAKPEQFAFPGKLRTDPNRRRRDATQKYLYDYSRGARRKT